MEANNIELLIGLGKVAGIGGLSLGVLLIVFRDVIRKSIFSTLTKENSYKLLRLIIVLVWSISIFGLGSWLMLQMKVRANNDTNDNQAFQRTNLNFSFVENLGAVAKPEVYAPFPDTVRALQILPTGEMKSSYIPPKANDSTEFRGDYVSALKSEFAYGKYIDDIDVYFSQKTLDVLDRLSRDEINLRYVIPKEIADDMLMKAEAIRSTNGLFLNFGNFHQALYRIYFYLKRVDAFTRGSSYIMQHEELRNELPEEIKKRASICLEKFIKSEFDALYFSCPDTFLSIDEVFHDRFVPEFSVEYPADIPYYGPICAKWVFHQLNLFTNPMTKKYYTNELSYVLSKIAATSDDKPDSSELKLVAINDSKKTSMITKLTLRVINVTPSFTTNFPIALSGLGDARQFELQGKINLNNAHDHYDLWKDATGSFQQTDAWELQPNETAMLKWDISGEEGFDYRFVVDVKGVQNGEEFLHSSPEYVLHRPKRVEVRKLPEKLSLDLNSVDVVRIFLPGPLSIQNLGSYEELLTTIPISAKKYIVIDKVKDFGLGQVRDRLLRSNVSLGTGMIEPQIPYMFSFGDHFAVITTENYDVGVVIHNTNKVKKLNKLFDRSFLL